MSGAENTMRVPLLSAFALGMLLVAGCTEPSTPATASMTVEPAPPPSVSDLTGSITGVIVDEELKPLSGVDVAIVETRNRTQTDEGGVYTINGIGAGSYTIHFALLGFQESGKRVDIIAGEIAYVNATMKPFVIIDAYQFTVPRASFMKLGQWTVNHVQQALNQSVLNEQLCSDCWHVLVLEAGIVSAQTETTWVPSVTNPVTNQWMGIGVSKSWGDGQLSTYFIIEDFSNGRKFVWDGADLAELKGGAKIRVNVQGAGAGHPGVMFQQKVDVYTTFGVNYSIDGNFTALPPK